MRRYQSRILAVAFHYTRNAEEARDVTQDIFIKVYERLSTFKGGDRFLPWMLSLARNACIDHLRRRKARPPASDVVLDDGPDLADSAPGPEEASAEAARRRLLYRAIDKMSEKNREIILLKEIQGLKLEEISRMLALPVGTVKSRSNRARLELAGKVRVLDPSYGT